MLASNRRLRHRTQRRREPHKHFAELKASEFQGLFDGYLPQHVEVCTFDADGIEAEGL